MHAQRARRNIHIHVHDHRSIDIGGFVGGFLESQHPRSHGKFAKKGTGSVGGAAKSALKSTAKATAHEIGHTGKADVEALQKHFAPNSPARKSLGNSVRRVASSLPALMKTHFKEEKEKFVDAGHALKHIFTGNKPTSHEVAALTKVAFTVLMSVGGALSHGDPTGSVGHLIAAIAQDVAQHTALEHAGEAGIGLGRFAHHRIRQRTAHAGASTGDAPDEMKLLQDFLERLAKNVESMQLKEPK